MDKELKEIQFKPDQVRTSKAEALAKIILYLDAPDIEGQFDKLNGDYHSKEKFIVTWNANWKDIPSEFGLDKTDSFFSDFSGGIKCIYVCRSLFHEKQLGAYGSFERGLIEGGMKLCPDKEAKLNFYNKYALRYNERIKKQK